jgi:hypothetical protein
MFSVKFRYTQREFLPPPCRPRPRPRTDKAFVPSIDDKVVCVCVCVCVCVHLLHSPTSSKFCADIVSYRCKEDENNITTVIVDLYSCLSHA